MKTNFGTPLSRHEMKNVLGGLRDGCSISANCNKKVYNFDKKIWEDKLVATVSCTGSGNCVGTLNGVSCDQSGGTTDTGTCPAGSGLA